MTEITVRSWLARSILVTVLWAAVAAADLGHEKEGELAAGVKSRIGWWETSKEQYDHMAGGHGYFDPTTIESRESDLGFLVGPELKYTYRSLFARGSYLWGGYGLSNGGDADLECLGIDVGYYSRESVRGLHAGVFLGYRRLDASFAGLTDSQIADHSISDAVLGFMLGGEPQTPGFQWGIELVTGIQGLVNVSDEEEYVENPAILEGEVTIGYRFKDIPLTVNVGYGVWSYADKAREYPYSPSIIIDKIVERWEDWGHGVILNLTYSF